MPDPRDSFGKPEPPLWNATDHRLESLTHAISFEVPYPARIVGMATPCGKDSSCIMMNYLT